MQQRETFDRTNPRFAPGLARALAPVILVTQLIVMRANLQTASAQTPATPNPPLMKEEDRLPYLRKLKEFLEADPLDTAEFERQFDVKLECRPWRDTGKVCDYRTNEVRWPYSIHGTASEKASFFMRGTGTKDMLWLSLLESDNPGSYNCITGEMLRRIFGPPAWKGDIGLAETGTPRPDRTWLFSSHGHDKFGRRVVIVTTGVYSCTGTLQITVHPLK